MSLCEWCHSFDIQAFSSGRSAWGGRRAGDLLQSAQAGCNFCSVVVERLDATGFDIRRGLHHIHFDIEREGGSRSRQRPLKIALLRAYISTYNSPAAVAGDVVGKYAKRDGRTENSITAIREWLSSCAGPSHRVCRQALSGCDEFPDDDDAPLPSRCLEVLESGDDAPQPRFRLAETAGKRGRYITMSHRWVSPFTEASATVRANLQSRLAGSQLDSLPRLFRQTLHICRRLGIRYAWIDSVCIVQDNPADWHTESARMAQYYQRAVFTLAATGGGDEANLHEYGLFGRHALDERRLLVRLPYRDGAGSRRGHFYLYPVDRALGQCYHDFVSRGELLRRGWVFQEWTLSRRLVCYTPAGFVFQCKARLPPRSEFGQAITEQTCQTLKPEHAQRLLSDSHFDMSSAARIYEAWRRIVESYSPLRLTKPEQDRLVAISGVADQFGRALRHLARQDDGDDGGPSSSTYLAGVWLGDVVEGLLWQRVLPGGNQAPSHPDARLNTIPTWSWASIDASISWSHVLPARGRASTTCCLMEGVVGDNGDSLADQQQQQHPAAPPQVAELSDQLVFPSTPGREASNSVASAQVDVRDTVLPLLRVRGKLPPVKLHATLGGPPKKTVAFLTGSVKSSWYASDLDKAHGQDKTLDTYSWRSVSSPLQAGLIAGWASIEHPEFQADNAFESGQVVHALIVRKTAGVRGGVRLGYLSLWHHVYDVLFLRRTEKVRDGFERLGVGQLFGKDIDNDIRLATERSVLLI